MRTFSPGLLYLTLLFSASALFGVDVYINDRFVNRYDRSFITPLSYRLPVSEETGITLDEVLPPFYEIDEISARSGTTVAVVPGSDLSEQLSNFFLINTNDGIDFLFPGNRIRSIDRLEVRGELIEHRSDDKPDLEVWISWEGAPELKREISRYALLHDISIKATEVPRADSKLLAVIRAGGHVPDVVMVKSDNIPALVLAKALQNVDYLTLQDFEPKGKDAFRLERKLWAVPFYFDTQVLFYNTYMVPDIPPDEWTTDEMVSISKRLLERGITPMSWNAYSAYWLVPFQIGFGKQAIVDTADTITINDPPTTRAIEFLLSLRDRGLLEILERDAMISLFASGRIGMILSGSYSIPQFLAIQIPFNIIAYPYIPETGRFIAPMLDFKGFAITRKTDNPVLARRLIQFLTGPGVQQRFTGQLAKIPAKRDIWPIWAADNPFADALLKSLEIGIVVPPARSYPIYKNTMWKILRFIYSGQMAIPEALLEGQKIIDANIEALNK